MNGRNETERCIQINQFKQVTPVTGSLATVWALNINYSLQLLSNFKFSVFFFFS